MSVNIDITQKVYDFIDGATGQKLSAEEFAKKYPAVGIARHATSIGNEETTKRVQEQTKE